MHELSVMAALYEQVREIADRHSANRVDSIVLEVGDFSNVIPELLRLAFDAFSRVEPLLNGARLEIVGVPVELHCRDCGLDFRPGRVRFRCPDCRSPRTEIVRGDELVLRNMELEIDEDEEDEHGIKTPRPGLGEHPQSQ